MARLYFAHPTCDISCDLFVTSSKKTQMTQGQMGFYLQK